MTRVLPFKVGAPPAATKSRAAGWVTRVSEKVGLKAALLRLTIVSTPPSPMAEKSARVTLLLMLAASARATASRPSPLPTMRMMVTPFRSTR